MATQTKTKTGQTQKSKSIPANIVWFEIPADDLARARKFYKDLFGWKIAPFRGMDDFQHIDTGGPDASPDGGMLPRKHPDHTVTNYVSVASVDKFAAKVEKLGGKICMAKTAVPQMGYFAVCQDTENNMFGIWEKDEKAK